MRKIVYIIPLIFIILGITCGLLYIPHYVEQNILPELALKNGIKKFSCKIQQIGLFNTTISQLKTGYDNKYDDKKETILAQFIEIKYSPLSLWNKSINEIQISGLDILCTIKNGKILFPGFNTNSKTKSNTKETTNIKPIQSPVSIKKISITGAFQAIPWENQSQQNLQHPKQQLKNRQWENRSYFIPFKLTVIPEKGNFNKISVNLSILPMGQPIAISGKVNLLKNQVALSITGSAIPIDNFISCFDNIQGLNIKGDIKLNINTDLTISPFNINSAQCIIRLDNLNGSYNEILFDKNTPFTITINKEEKKEWEINLTPFKIFTPIPIEFSSITGKLIHKENNLNFLGEYKIKTDKFKSNKKFPVSIQDSIVINGIFSGDLTAESNLNFKTTGSSGKEKTALNNNITVAGVHINTKKLSYNLSMALDKTNYQVKAKLSGNLLKLTKNKLDCKLNSFSITTSADFNKTNSKIKGDYQISANGLSLIQEKRKCLFPQATIKGSFIKNKNDCLQNQTLFNIQNGSFFDNTIAFKANGIFASLPFKYPFQNNAKTGKLKISSLTYHKPNSDKLIKLGSIDGTLKQSGKKLIYTGKFNNQFMENMDINFNIHSDFRTPYIQNVTAKFQCTDFRPSSPIDLGQFSPVANKIFLDGNLSFNGTLNMLNNKLKCSAQASFKDGTLNYPEKKVLIEGINFGINIPNVFNIYSKPAQKITFSHASFANVEVGDGNIEYQLEQGGSILIERAKFNWCKGLISSEALRIIPDVDNYDFVLYCNRVNLASVLEQVGIAHAEGSGMVSGRIPITVNNKKITVNKGYLYSTPGTTGRLRVQGAEILTRGVQKNTPQYAQLELAQEALKDFEYKWAKVDIKTHAGELMVSMKFDGKPANPLPFVYKKETGSFVKVKSETKGLIFQGIRLDANFSLPLDQIIQYKELLKIFSK